MRALVEMEGSGLVPLLEGDKYEDLARMYSLFRHVCTPCSCLNVLPPTAMPPSTCSYSDVHYHAALHD